MRPNHRGQSPPHLVGISRISSSACMERATSQRRSRSGRPELLIISRDNQLKIKQEVQIYLLSTSTLNHVEAFHLATAPHLSLIKNGGPRYSLQIWWCAPHSAQRGGRTSAACSINALTASSKATMTRTCTGQNLIVSQSCGQSHITRCVHEQSVHAREVHAAEHDYHDSAWTRRTESYPQIYFDKLCDHDSFKLAT